MKPNDHHPGPAARLALAFHDNPYLLWLLVAVLLVSGLSALRGLPRIEDPRITQRNASVTTLLPGASAQRVEALVTRKLEDALRRVAEVKRLESSSRPGLSFIAIELQDDIGPGANELAFAKIRDRLADARPDLPSETTAPKFDDERGAVAFALVTAVTWTGKGPVPLGLLKRSAEELGDRLRGLPGTELVSLYGAPEEEITVSANADALATLGLRAAELAARVNGADPKLPAGVLRGARHDLPLEISGELDSKGSVEAVPVAPGETGELVSVADLASVTRGWRQPAEEMALANGRRAVLVAARARPGIRVDQWAETARQAVAELAASLPAGVAAEISFDQSAYTTERLTGLGLNLAAGAGVVTLVVVLAMGWRSALVVSSALPLTAAAALFGLALVGQQIHQMTVFGLIVAVGLLIDNAIVVVDECARRLRSGLTPRAALIAAVDHLAGPLLASTLTTVLAFMPILLLPGNVGDFVGPIAISVILALVASLAIALTVIAVLALRHSAAEPEQPPGWWSAGLQSARGDRLWTAVVAAALRRPWLALASTALPAALGFALVPTLGQQFFPPADRDQVEIEVRLSPGTSLQHTADAVERLEALMRAQPEVQRVDWRLGGSYPSVYYNLIMNRDHDSGYAHGIVQTTDAAAAHTVLLRLQPLLDEAVPEAQVVLQAFGQGPPRDAPVAFRLLGPSVDILRALGEELRAVMQGVPGILHSRASIEGGQPKLVLTADPQAARLAGLALSDLANQLQAGLEGTLGGSVLEDLEELPVRVRFDEERRGNLERLETLSLVAPDAAAAGRWVPLAALGSLDLQPVLTAVSRRDGIRMNQVLGFVAPGVLAVDATRSVLEALERAGFETPPGYRLWVAGDSEEQGRAVGQLATYAPVLGVIALAALVLSFRSVSLAALVTVVAVLSAGLGLLALRIGGYPLGFNAIIGTSGLVGVAINGAIVVLAAIRSVPAARAAEPLAMVAAVRDATRHVVATSLTTAGGFLPLLLFTGGDFWPPLAIVLAGGVLLSVPLALLFTPAAYRLLVGRTRARPVDLGPQQTTIQYAEA